MCLIKIWEKRLLFSIYLLCCDRTDLFIAAGRRSRIFIRGPAWRHTAPRSLIDHWRAPSAARCPIYTWSFPRIVSTCTHRTEARRRCRGTLETFSIPECEEYLGSFIRQVVSGNRCRFRCRFILMPRSAECFKLKSVTRDFPSRFFAV